MPQLRQKFTYLSFYNLVFGTLSTEFNFGRNVTEHTLLIKIIKGFFACLIHSGGRQFKIISPTVCINKFVCSHEGKI